MEAQLRPVEQVDADLAKAQFLVPDEQREYRQKVLTTDRDTAYTLLREQMVKKSCDELVIPDYIKQGGFSHEVVFKEGYNAAINTLLTLLDHIYGKTDALTK